jgi:hypothetical protein
VLGSARVFLSDDYSSGPAHHKMGRGKVGQAPPICSSALPSRLAWF